MGYTEKQARAKAQQIFTRFGAKIHLACSNSIVEESFLAGFIGVEAGVERKTGLISETATRFEPHVYQRLKAVRDGLLGSYNKITRADLANATDDALRNLATSFGLSQIMGWHIIRNLRCTIAQLRDPETHLFYTVRLLVLTGGSHLRDKNYGNVLRIWNTGSANGKTYHADYVSNALLVKKHYERILKENRNAFKNLATSAAATAIESQSTAIPEPMSVTDGADETSGRLSTDGQSSAQIAENITNVVNGDKKLPDNFKPENKTVDAPPPSGFMRKAWTWVLGFGIVPPSAGVVIETIRNLYADGSVNLKDSLLIAGQIGKFIFPYVVYVAVAFIVFWGIKEMG